jgi:hypothetical protein
LKLNNQYNLTLLICFFGLVNGNFSFAQESRSSESFTIFGDTLFQGKWSARGIDNQAGQIAFAEYDTYDSSFTFITTQGYIFTTKESAIDWLLLNPQHIFDHPIVGFSRFSTGGKTYLNVVTRDGFYYHSEDLGKSWNSGIGLKAIEGFTTVQKMVQAGNGDILLLLEEKLGQADITLYESNDHGASFNKIKTFNSPIPLALNNYDISKPIGNDSIVLILYVDTLSIYNVFTDSFKFHSKVPAFSFREARISGSFSNGNSNFYLCRGGSIYQYDRINSFWNRKSQISFESRLPHTFSASSTKINSLFIGGYDFHKSTDTAKTWSVQNTLNDFLVNKSSKLHPGINFIQSFKNVRQSEIFLIASDGGLFLSQDQLNTVINLTPNGIQIGNHYDLKILKDNTSKLYTSMESQGLHTYTNYNPDSTINSEHIAWSSNFGLGSSKSNNNLWTASEHEVGYVSSLTDRFYRTSWTYSDSLTLGGNKPILEAHPNISTEAFCSGLYPKNDPDKKSYIYKLSYDGTDINAEPMNKNFNLNLSKTEFISAFEISEINDSNWYVITNEGNFYGSADAGATWKRSAFFNGLLSNRKFGSTILVSPITEGLVYVGGRGNGNGSIYYSQNFGKDFKLLGSGLKNTEVFGISSVKNDSLLFVATKNGPYVYSEKFGAWESLSTRDIPIINWTCVQAFENENSVWFGTFGRGLWEFDYQYFKGSINSMSNVPSTESSIQLYPNPTNGILKIETLVEFESVSIFSIEGKKVESFTINNSNEIDIQSLETGIYFLRFQLENGQVSNHKIIKE